MHASGRCAMGFQNKERVAEKWSKDPDRKNAGAPWSNWVMLVIMIFAVRWKSAPFSGVKKYPSSKGFNSPPDFFLYFLPSKFIHYIFFGFSSSAFFYTGTCICFMDSQGGNPWIKTSDAPIAKCLVLSTFSKQKRRWNNMIPPLSINSLRTPLEDIMIDRRTIFEIHRMACEKPLNGYPRFRKSAISHNYVPMPTWYTFKSLALVYFLSPVNKPC